MAINMQKEQNNKAQFDMSLNSNAKAFYALTSSLYKKPIQSIVRELTSNAIDAMKMINSNSPIFININSDDKLNFSVQDFGIGMSLEQVFETFSVYFNSSKENNINQIGGFGLGGKTPFIYTNEFTLETTCPEDGIRRTFIFKMDNNIPSFNYLEELDEQDSETKGTKVSFDLKNTKDAEMFLDEAKFFATFNTFPICIYNKNQKIELKIDEKLEQSIEELNKCSISLIKNDYLSNIDNKEDFYVRYNGIIYSFPLNLVKENKINLIQVLSGKKMLYKSYYHLIIDVTQQLNSVLEFNISRESLIINKHNEELIQKAFLKIFINILLTRYSEIKTTLETTTLSSLSDYINLLADNYSLYEILSSFDKDWNFKKIMITKFSDDENVGKLNEYAKQIYVALTNLYVFISESLDNNTINIKSALKYTKIINHSLDISEYNYGLQSFLEDKVIFLISKKNKYLKCFTKTYLLNNKEICLIVLNEEEAERLITKEDEKKLENFCLEQGFCTKKTSKTGQVQVKKQAYFSKTYLKDLKERLNFDKEYNKVSFILCEDYLSKKDILSIKFIIEHNNLDFNFIFLNNEDFLSINEEELDQQNVILVKPDISFFEIYHSFVYATRPILKDFKDKIFKKNEESAYRYLNNRIYNLFFGSDIQNSYSIIKNNEYIKSKVVNFANNQRFYDFCENNLEKSLKEQNIKTINLNINLENLSKSLGMGDFCSYSEYKKIYKKYANRKLNYLVIYSYLIDLHKDNTKKSLNYKFIKEIDLYKNFINERKYFNFEQYLKENKESPFSFFNKANLFKQLKDLIN